MRNMSFAMTQSEIIAQTKFVTRRFGWWHLKPDDLVQPVKKSMGLKKGERVLKLGDPIQIVKTTREPLNNINQADCILEGFPNLTPAQFVEMLVKHYRCKPDQECNRIQFKYTYTCKLCHKPTPDARGTKDLQPLCRLCSAKHLFNTDGSGSGGFNHKTIDTSDYNIQYGRRSPAARAKACERDCGGVANCHISRYCDNWIAK